MIQEAELEKAEELNEQAKPGEDFEPPRLIFVLQAQEYWPGSESNPEAMAMRASKEKAFAEAGHEPFRGAFDYKRLTVATYIKCSGYGYVSRRDYLQYFNPNLPGYRFIIENYPESEREGWRERYEYRQQGEYKRQRELEYSSGMSHKKKCAMEARISELEAIVAEVQKENQQLQKKLLKKKENCRRKRL
ncbi:hypothetical protein L1049_022208 [Liquidambar formosana]|uniref:Uncharacterized protein n=1 Tax=Liquidambar formosana TaxID=63359 RepID=A0AAP0RDY4_LIQFO